MVTSYVLRAGWTKGGARAGRAPPGWLDPQDPLAAGDAGRAGADGLENRGLVERLDERVELRAGAGELDRVGGFGHVEDTAAEDVGHALHLFAVLAGRPHLDQHQLALD